jgi:hypothetical protein
LGGWPKPHLFWFCFLCGADTLVRTLPSDDRFNNNGIVSALDS